MIADDRLFFQSFSQQQLYEKLGQKTWFFEEGQVKSLVTKVEAKRGTYLFLPYVPLVTENAELLGFFSKLEVQAKKEKACCIRISPFWSDTPNSRTVLEKIGFRLSPIHQLAESLWILDLEGKSEDQLFQAMDKKHRNLIRRAVKEGVHVTMSTDSSAVDRFIRLHEQTVDRHQFTPYPKSYFQAQVELFKPHDQVKVFESWYHGVLLSSAVIMLYGNSAAYHHGASSSDPVFRKIPASYLLQWEAIREAKKRGMKTYNFWGIAPEGVSDHPFSGITHFKTGFGGRRLELVPCHDLVIDAKKYAILWLVEKFRKWRRGF